MDSDDDGESNYSVDSEHWLDDAEDFFDNEYMEEEEVDFEDWNEIMWTVPFSVSNHLQLIPTGTHLKQYMLHPPVTWV